MTGAPRVVVEILAYAPTEFFHCQHCEVAWSQVGLGQRIHAEQRAAGLPPELQAEYAALAEWVREATARYDDRIEVRLVDPASLEGVWKALRHGTRRFPALVVDGQRRVTGFDREQWNLAVAGRVGAEPGRKEVADRAHREA